VSQSLSHGFPPWRVNFSPGDSTVFIAITDSVQNASGLG
jgi:hypothetical protein